MGQIGSYHSWTRHVDHYCLLPHCSNPQHLREYNSATNTRLGNDMENGQWLELFHPFTSV
ncbi:hypothetical protein BJV74DRAFT_850205, partial [Russula compacta]